MIDYLKKWFSKQEPQERQEPTLAVRGYDAARRGRLSSDWVTGSGSADSELYVSLSTMRDRSRDMIRNNPYAASAQRIVRNNVVGVGIGFQSQIKFPDGTLDDKLNTEIEGKFLEWSRKKNCHTAGILSLNEICNTILSQAFEAGEILIRKRFMAFGDSRIPFALEVIEADRLADRYNRQRDNNGHTIRMGVEVDQWGRPVAYFFLKGHPGDYGLGIALTDLERVPANEVIHLYIAERFPQTRGVPWLHTAISRLRDMGGYTEAEVVAARSSACIAGFIHSESDDSPENKEGSVLQVKPGAFVHLAPGEDISAFNPNRPTNSLEPFMRFMIREVATGIGVSYESLSRDYSQSNYSSSRLSLLDDRITWRILQGWLVSNFLYEVYKDWLNMAVLCGEVRIRDFETDPQKYRQARFRPPGWSWIDPTKEVQAYKEAVKAGFMTLSDVIAQTGQGSDLEDLLKTRRAELDKQKELDLKFDTDPGTPSVKDKKDEKIDPQ